MYLHAIAFDTIDLATLLQGTGGEHKLKYGACGGAATGPHAWHSSPAWRCTPPLPSSHPMGLRRVHVQARPGLHDPAHLAAAAAA
jgi:hypothetical protein